MNKAGVRRAALALAATVGLAGFGVGHAVASRDDSTSELGSYPIRSQDSPFIHGQRPGEVKRP